MEMNQFADMSKDLYTQIKVVENLVKGDLYKEAGKLLKTAQENCDNLESLMTPDNAIQTRIIDNRRREIGWIQDAIRHGMAKAASKPAAKKRVAKPK